MKKLLASIFMLFATLVCSQAIAATETNQEKLNKEAPSTRPDAVIFKVHEVTPVAEDGMVTGCDFTVTLYNRTSVNFRTFTLNLDWKDVVDETIKFDTYVSNIINKEEAEMFKNIVANDKKATTPLNAKITVNAFGADKQISVRSHIDTERCYLMLNNATFSVTPCEMVKVGVSTGGGNTSGEKSNCTNLFELVDTSNPEYFGQFKKISATDEQEQNIQQQKSELSSIDDIIGKIVENMGMADKALTNSK